MKKIISIIFITVILNSCGSVSNFFGGEDIDKDRIQGDRISILSLEISFFFKRSFLDLLGSWLL